ANLVDELCATPLEELGDAVEHLTTVLARCAGPAVERLARGDPRVTALLARGLGGIREELALRRRDLVGATRLAAGELAADVELVGLGDREVRHHLAPFLVVVAGRACSGDATEASHPEDSRYAA